LKEIGKTPSNRWFAFRVCRNTGFLYVLASNAKEKKIMKRKMVFGVLAFLLVLQAQTVFADTVSMELNG